MFRVFFAGIFNFLYIYKKLKSNSPIKLVCIDTSTTIQSDVDTLHRCGAAGARGAHNSEVRCSNHLAGSVQFRQ
jgi:hypothetical protein